MKIVKRRRGTAIIETPKGILMTQDRGSHFILVGGGAERGETVREAVEREIKEETGLDSTYTRFLFRHEGKPYLSRQGQYVKDYHSVFLVRTVGVPKPKNEVVKISYYPNPNMIIYKSSREILRKYLS